MAGKSLVSTQIKCQKTLESRDNKLDRGDISLEVLDQELDQKLDRIFLKEQKSLLFVLSQ